VLLKDDAVGDIATPRAEPASEKLGNLRSLPKGFRPLQVGVSEIIAGRAGGAPCPAIHATLPKIEKAAQQFQTSGRRSSNC